MSSSTKILPIVTIQHDFETVIADVRDGTVEAEDFWLSCYRQGQTSVHGKVRVTLDRGEVVLTGRGGVQLDKERVSSALRLTLVETAR
jgi:proteasomal ATPase-associated factor 1